MQFLRYSLLPMVKPLLSLRFFCMYKKRKESQSSCDSIKRKRVSKMPISQKDQLTLLQDLLRNHHTDACGSKSECEQIARLVQSLQNQETIHQDLLPLLNDVDQYSKNGIVSSDLNEHISSSKEDLSQWVDTMNQLI